MNHYYVVAVKFGSTPYYISADGSVRIDIQNAVKHEKREDAELACRRCKWAGAAYVQEVKETTPISAPISVDVELGKPNKYPKHIKKGPQKTPKQIAGKVRN